jgi:hypothetical protein
MKSIKKILPIKDTPERSARSNPKSVVTANSKTKGPDHPTFTYVPKRGRFTLPEALSATDTALSNACIF